MTYRTSTQFFKDVSEALGLPPDLPATYFQIACNPGELPEIQITLLIADKASKKLAEILRHYQLVEKEQ